MTVRIAVVAFSYYPSDPRVRRETEALIEAGHCVDVICLRGTGEAEKEIVDGAQVYRLYGLTRQRKRAGKVRYIWAYLYFTCLAFFTLSILYMRKRYDLIQVHNMPDALVFSALLPRLCGCKIILDHHDPMPEVYMSKYLVEATHPIIRLIRLMERCSIRFSDLVLAVNSSCCELIIRRGCPRSKVHIVMNLPQDSVFGSNPANTNPDVTAKKNSFVLMYHGTITERNGLGVALEAIERVRERIPNLVFEVYGEGDFLNELLDLVKKKNLGEIVRYHGFVRPEKIAEAIQSSDVGLIPNAACAYWEYVTPTRMFEYLYLGKPVIVPRTKAILDCFDDESLYFFESGNADSLADVLFEVYANPNRVRAVLARGISICNSKYRWAAEKQRFVDVVQELVRNITPYDPAEKTKHLM